MPGTAMIAFEAVTKRFGARRGRGGVEALSSVTLEVPAGEAWGVVGPNGAGKTTLFALLLGFLHPTEGRVRLGGAAPRRYLRRHGASYLPERFRLPPEWTVRPTLVALARLEGYDAAEARRRADQAIERFGLGPHAGKAVGALSHGLLQRLGLAQALLGEHELVVLDEPTEGLDPLWRIRFRAVVEELRRAGRTVLLASHDLAEVERLAGKAVLLERGHVREILDLAPTGGERTYRLELAGEAPALEEAFPGAEPMAGAPGVYRVRAADAAELSRRLAALLDAGAVVASVAPATEALEERVRRALGRES
ncbi:MAG: ABC transporter ATP-binding protein [Gemmatimonadetes bacterium]|nr:ABC transporter ATP-binding protein [Gemmatimonadota bacterium]